MQRVVEVLPYVDQHSEVVKGDVLRYQYSVKFASSVLPAPTPPMLISWNYAGETVVSSTINQPDSVISSHSVTAEPEIVPSYGFTVNFSSPLIRSDYATNAPAFVYIRHSTPYTVLC